jgi:hypothetical protein
VLFREQMELLSWEGAVLFYTGEVSSKWTVGLVESPTLAGTSNEDQWLTR